MSALNLSAREAAALHRLLDAYTAGAGDEGDPGLEDLRAVHRKVGRLPQDHCRYDTYRPPTVTCLFNARPHPLDDECQSVDYGPHPFEVTTGPMAVPFSARMCRCGQTHTPTSAPCRWWGHPDPEEKTDA